MSHVAPVAAPPEVHATEVLSGHCLNCRHRLAGPYCHQCGQTASTPRRITLHYLHDIPHSVWHVDHGVVYTLRELLRRPGHAVRRYLAGERAPFFRPLSLLLLLAGVKSFFYLTLHIVPFYADPRMSEATRKMQTDMLGFITKYQTWVQVGMLPISAAFLHWLLRRRTGYSYAEHLVAATMFTSAFVAIELLFLPVLWYYSAREGVMLISLVLLVSAVGYKSWGAAQLQDDRTGRYAAGGRWARAVVATTLEYGLLMVFSMAIMIVMLILHKAKYGTVLK